MKKILLLFLLLTTSIGVVLALPIDGSGTVIRQERTLASFSQIKVGSAFTVQITQGSSQSVVVEAEDNLIELIKTNVSNGKLKIYLDAGIVNGIKNTKPMILYITMPELSDLNVSGAAKVTFETPMRTKGKMEIGLSGSSKLTAGAVHAGSLKMDCSGASKLTTGELHAGSLEMGFSGSSKAELDLFTHESSTTKAGQASIKLTGASKLTMNKIQIGTLELSLSGSSKAELNLLAENMKLSLSGASKVDLTGEAAKQVIKTSGSSKADAGGLKGTEAQVEASGSSSIVTSPIKISYLNTSGSSSVKQR